MYILTNKEELIMTTNNVPKSSGKTREFSTGAHRDNAEGKGSCDLLPLLQVGTLMNDSVIFSIANFMETKDKLFLYQALKEGCKTLPQYKDVGLAGMMLEASLLFEAGANKYGENTWKNGMPLKCYLDSGIRHYLKTLRGDIDEPHYRGFVWNLLCAIWTIDNVPNALDDLIVIEK